MQESWEIVKKLKLKRTRSFRIRVLEKFLRFSAHCSNSVEATLAWFLVRAKRTGLLRSGLCHGCAASPIDVNQATGASSSGTDREDLLSITVIRERNFPDVLPGFRIERECCRYLPAVDCHDHRAVEVASDLDRCSIQC